MTKRLTDKTIVVTGAGGGLGRTSAQLFASEGAHVVLVDINADGLVETCRLIETEGGACSSHIADLSDESVITALGETLCSKHPSIHALYNNAGAAYGEVNMMIDDMSMDRWLFFLTLNSLSPLFVAKAIRPSLANAKGVVINQSSMASFQPANVYGTTKAMLNSLTHGMANVFSGDGIRVVAIAPGIMETEANKAALDKETYTRVQGMQLIEGHGTADDIANLALFLASDEARFINCEIIGCDAGNRLRGWRY